MSKLPVKLIVRLVFDENLSNMKINKNNHRKLRFVTAK